jgi:hypothetical protein
MAWRAMAGIAAVVGLALAGSAQAAVFAWTFRGVVTDGHDATGVFGSASDDLAGLAWQAVVVTDTSTPGATYTDGGAFTLIQGSAPAAPVRITFTLEGVTRAFGVVPDDPLGLGAADSYQGQVDGAIAGFPYDEEVQIHADNSRDYGTAQTLRFLEEQIDLLGVGAGLNFLPGPDLTTLPSLTPPAGATFVGAVRLFSSTTDVATDTQLVDEDVSADLTITSITRGGVPEPASWTLMIAGFGAIGAMARRRRDAAKAFGYETPPLERTRSSAG